MSRDASDPTDQELIDFIGPYEGKIGWVYLDSKGLPSIGIGTNLMPEGILRRADLRRVKNHKFNKGRYL